MVLHSLLYLRLFVSNLNNVSTAYQILENHLFKIQEARITSFVDV